jgi:3-oxoacyl-ACP reductase-like protein
VSRLSNDEADILANIGSQCLPIPPEVFCEEISERSTKSKKTTTPKQPKKKDKPKKASGAAAAPEPHISDEEEEPEEVMMMIQIPWMQTYLAYIMNKEIFEDPVEGRRVIQRSKAFIVVKGELYK